ncbi:MAG: hypothetical protein RL685_4398 [Pseudomonadota bacterium]|jgi:hypothetical protein
MLGSRNRGRGWLHCGLTLVLGCASAQPPASNRTFYDWSLGDRAASDFEQPRQTLDWPANQSAPDFVGVEVLQGAVRFSRPKNWLMRNASNQPEAAYVHYVSPNAYSFVIYQRPFAAGQSWPALCASYEAELQAAGGKVVGHDIPIATSRGQGRAYSIDTTFKSSSGPLISHSREMLLRGQRRAVLVQIVHQEQDLAEDDLELLRAIGTLEVN